MFILQSNPYSPSLKDAHHTCPSLLYLLSFHLILTVLYILSPSNPYIYFSIKQTPVYYYLSSILPVFYLHYFLVSCQSYFPPYCLIHWPLLANTWTSHFPSSSIPTVHSSYASTHPPSSPALIFTPSLASNFASSPYPSVLFLFHLQPSIPHCHSHWPPFLSTTPFILAWHTYSSLFFYFAIHTSLQQAHISVSLLTSLQRLPHLT